MRVCVCVWKLVMSSTREYSTVKRILGIKRGPVMLYVCVCVSGVKKDFVDNKGDDERQKVETDLIYCFFLPSRKKGLATKTPPRTFRLCGIRRSSPKPGLPLTLPAQFILQRHTCNGHVDVRTCCWVLRQLSQLGLYYVANMYILSYLKGGYVKRRVHKSVT